MAKGKKQKAWKEVKSEIKHWWQVPFYFIEWCCELILPKLTNLAFFKILEYAGRLTILVAVFLYFAEKDDRRLARQYQAWQIVNASHDKGSDGGRSIALEYLNKNGTVLTRLNASNAFLDCINLKGAFLAESNFSKTRLFAANFSGATLHNSDFSGARINNADFSQAMLINVNFSDADLSGSKLNRADFTIACLKNSNFSHTYLKNAKVERAFLEGADFYCACLVNSNLDRIQNWKKIKNIAYANIYGVKNPPDGFIEWAKEQGAVTFEKDRDWESFLEKEGVVGNY